MKRERQVFLDKVEEYVPLREAEVLEIGCGSGYQSAEIAVRCRSLIGIDPSDEKLILAKQLPVPNASFVKGTAERLPFEDRRFNAVFFTLSFHHVPAENMSEAINEALRVLKENGSIIFLEPGTKGNFFEAEIFFDAGDGDETREKATAYEAMMAHPRLEPVAEIPDETRFLKVSPEAFMRTLWPKKNLDQLKTFLSDHGFSLWAERRINIFMPK